MLYRLCNLSMLKLSFLSWTAAICCTERHYWDKCLNISIITWRACIHPEKGLGWSVNIKDISPSKSNITPYNLHYLLPSERNMTIVFFAFISRRLCLVSVRSTKCHLSLSGHFVALKDILETDVWISIITWHARIHPERGWSVNLKGISPNKSNITPYNRHFLLQSERKMTIVFRLWSSYSLAHTTSDKQCSKFIISWALYIGRTTSNCSPVLNNCCVMFLYASERQTKHSNCSLNQLHVPSLLQQGAWLLLDKSSIIWITPPRTREGPTTK